MQTIEQKELQACFRKHKHAGNLERSLIFSGELTASDLPKLTIIGKMPNARAGRYGFVGMGWTILFVKDGVLYRAPHNKFGRMLDSILDVGVIETASD